LIGPNLVGVTWRRTQNQVSAMLFLNKNRTMDNAQKYNICTMNIFIVWIKLFGYPLSVFLKALLVTDSFLF
jgi:hypothetical protein